MPCCVILFPRGWAFEDTSCFWRSPCLRLPVCKQPAIAAGWCFCPCHLLGPGIRPETMTVLGQRSLGTATARCWQKGKPSPALISCVPGTWPPRGCLNLVNGRSRAVQKPRIPPAWLKKLGGRGALRGCELSVLSCQAPRIAAGRLDG